MSFDTNLTPDVSPTFGPIPAWDENTPLDGGPDTAPLNVQAKALLNMIYFLATTVGANYIGCDVTDDSPTPNSVQNQLIFLTGYAKLVRSNSANQITLAYDASNNLVLGLPQDINTTSSPTFATLNATKVSTNHLKGVNPSGKAPAVAWGTGAGANSTPTVGTLTGTDLGMQLTVQPSATPGASAAIAQITFAQAFDNAPMIYLSGGNAQARNALSALTGPALSAISTTGFTLAAVSALNASNTYVFNFLIVGQ